MTTITRSIDSMPGLTPYDDAYKTTQSLQIALHSKSEKAKRKKIHFIRPKCGEGHAISFLF